MAELIDEIDDDGAVIRVVTRAEMRAGNLLHRAVGVVVINSAHEILIHRRADHKDVWPGMWDLAAGGVVASGEDYTMAAERELAEELGITGATLELLGRGRFEDDRVRTIAHLFRATWDGPVSFDDGEVVDALWVTLDDLRRRIERGDPFVPDSLALAPPYLGL